MRESASIEPQILQKKIHQAKTIAMKTRSKNNNNVKAKKEYSRNPHGKAKPQMIIQ